MKNILFIGLLSIGFLFTGENVSAKQVRGVCFNSPSVSYYHYHHVPVIRYYPRNVVYSVRTVYLPAVTNRVTNVTHNVLTRTGNTTRNVLVHTRGVARNTVIRTENATRNVLRRTKGAVCNSLGCKR